MSKKIFKYLRQTIKKYYKKSEYIRFILDPFLGIYNLIIFYFFSDEEFSKMDVQSKNGIQTRSINPITLNEKIQWLKLHDRSKLHTICTRCCS